MRRPQRRPGPSLLHGVVERLPEPVRRVTALRPPGLLHHPSVRRAARRRVWGWAAAALVAMLVLSTLGRAERDRAAWGRTVDVVVARHDLDAGQSIVAGSAVVQRWPAALVADGALEEVPNGRRLTTPVRAGELLVDGRLAPPDAGPTGATLAADEVVVSVPLGSPPAAPAPGDHVDLYAPTGEVDPSDPTLGLVSTSASRLATRARVLAVRPEAVDVVVRAEEAREVAAAVLGGMVALVTVG
ncbi:MAG: SAF domain-containing protein [Microthrixaceae bacterium]